MRETLMTTMEVAAGGFLSTNTELLLHKILYPLRTNLMRAALRAWHKVLKTEKEENLVVQRLFDEPTASAEGVSLRMAQRRARFENEAFGFAWCLFENSKRHRIEILPSVVGQRRKTLEGCGV